MLALLAATIFAAPTWQLVWSDEFNGTGQPDPKKWTPEVGFVRNQEAQFYTNRRLENARVEGGNLVIEARKDGFEGHDVTSASITTQGLASWTYGKVEVRAKVPPGKGTWPAIWMLGDNIKTVNWPRCGEIDIMEYVGMDADKVYFNIHGPKLSEAKGSQSSANLTVPKISDGFHTYAMEWFPDRIDLFFDGKKTLTYLNDDRGDEETWPFHRPQYLLLNLAIGGNWGGQQGVDPAIFPARYLVDWVRVYREKK